MTKSERNRFLLQHTKAMVSQPKKNGPVNIYISPNDDLYGKLDFPFDTATFANYILEALSKAG